VIRASKSRVEGRPGTRTGQARRALRRQRGTLAGLTLCLAANGCLILDPIEFDDRQLPSHLDTPSPSGFARVPDVPESRCAGTLVQGMAFGVKVYDANTNEALTGRLIVNGGPNRNYVYTFAIPANGKYERGDVWQCAELERFDATCNHVELLVTSEFDSAFPYGTTDPFDVARMEWWVLGRARDTPNADPNDCARFPVGDEP
jgi:hypothetical protein